MKTCKTCGNVFETARCIPCRRAYMLRYRKANKLDIDKKRAEWSTANFDKRKTCGKCGGEYVGKECKPCRNKRNSAYNKSHPDISKKSHDAYRNRHPDRRKAVTSSWIERNREKRDATTKKWFEQNRHRVRVIQHNRRTRISSGGKLSPDIASRIFKRQRGKCACCGEPLGDDYHMDHIMPLALGGTNTDDNIQLLRAYCNRSKHAKHPIDYMQSRGFLL